MWTSIAPFAEAEHAYRREQIIDSISRGPRHHLVTKARRLARGLARGLDRLHSRHGTHHGTRHGTSHATSHGTHHGTSHGAHPGRASTTAARRRLQASLASSDRR